MIRFISKLSDFWRSAGKASAKAAGTRVRAADGRDFCHGPGRARRALKGLGAASLFVAMVATAAPTDPTSELARARHDLAISEQVLARVSEQADKARSDPATGPQERKRLEEYLANVSELVDANRKRVRSLEESLRTAPAGLPGGAGAGAVGISGAATGAEEVAALDARLSGSLTEFDQLLLEEARKAQARAPAAGSSRAYAGGSSAKAGGKGSGQSAENGSGRKAGSKDAGQSEADGSRAGSASTSTDGSTDPQGRGAGPGSPGGRIDGKDAGAPGATAAAPPDVGDGSDDDIVARQIRRAAEAERDPELRERLWDEYRKYKQGTKG
jgi:hypothetical protein